MDDDVMVFRRPSLPNLDDLVLKAHSKNNRGNIMRRDSSFYSHKIRSVSFDSRYIYFLFLLMPLWLVLMDDRFFTTLGL
jgi:hypothetical protein